MASSKTSELLAIIQDGDLIGIQEWLDLSDIRAIEHFFFKEDPISFAIEHQREAIAIFLLGKILEYPTLEEYYTGEKLEQFTTLAEAHELKILSATIDSILNTSSPETTIPLSDQYLNDRGTLGGNTLSANSTRARTIDIPQDSALHYLTMALDSVQLPTKMDEARDCVNSMGLEYYDQNGNTLLHMAAQHSSAMVYASVMQGLELNVKNFDGDTPLHISVRSGDWQITNALLMCGADLSLRNKAAQTPCDLASGCMLKIMNRYKPGLALAVVRSDHHSIQRLLRLWCNVNSKIRNGKSALELAAEKSTENVDAQKCHRLLSENKNTLDLVHAVLSEDVCQVRHILNNTTNYNVNTRFRDRNGSTLISQAIDQHNIEILKELINTRKIHGGTRVRVGENSEDTMPLYFRTLELDCPFTVWKVLHSYTTDAQLMTERDGDGNTAFIRIVQNGHSAEFVEAFLESSGGINVTDRNKEGVLARELAYEMRRPDIVNVIDQFVFNQLGKGFMMRLPINFYGQNVVQNMTNKKNDNLVEEALKMGEQQDIQATKYYRNVEKSACRLFRASARCEEKRIIQYNKADYRDQNGYTALTRAVVFNQLRSAELLLTDRPQLKLIADNYGRYPLHYAYAIPECESEKFVKLLLETDSELQEHLVDKDGLEAAEYRDLRDSEVVGNMLHDARTLDPYSKRGDPLGPVPEIDSQSEANIVRSQTKSKEQLSESFNGQRDEHYTFVIES